MNKTDMVADNILSKFFTGFYLANAVRRVARIPSWIAAPKSLGGSRNKSGCSANPNYMRTLRTSETKGGKRVPVEKQQRVLPWWRSVPNGTYAFFVRAGYKPVELDKGKTAVAVPSLDKLPGVIDTLITAVRKGELDQQLAEASKQATPKKSRKAA